MISDDDTHHKAIDTTKAAVLPHLAYQPMAHCTNGNTHANAHTALPIYVVAILQLSKITNPSNH